ncbi:MAG: hypothetical protein ACRDJH_26220 [Thermomicrobiales bacterium]
MGAFVSLAFGWEGSLEDISALDGALDRAGLQLRHAGQQAYGMREAAWIFSVAEEELALTSRCYQETGWVSTTLDIAEEVFEAAGDRVGRAELVETFVRLGADLLRRLGLRYVFFDEEAEAEIAPWQYRADVLFGITLVADGVPGLAEAARRPEVQRIERFDGGLALFRRLDPVPHYEPPNRPEAMHKPA